MVVYTSMLFLKKKNISVSERLPETKIIIIYVETCIAIFILVIFPPDFKSMVLYDKYIDLTKIKKSI